MIESATLELERTSAKCALQGGSPVRDDFLIFGSPLIGEDEIAEVVATLRSGWLGTGRIRASGMRVTNDRISARTPLAWAQISHSR